MREELIALRAEMKKENIDWYVIPTTDPHGSEYVNDHYKCRAFVSGFTGSAGTLLVGEEEAYLWTDGRYFLQAGSQLAGSGITLMKMGEPGVPTLIDFLKEKENYTLGFDGRVVSVEDGLEYDKLEVPIVWEKDLVNKVWADRPPIEPSRIYELPLSVTGRAATDKISDVRKAMKEQNVTHLLLAGLDEIAWLFNLRGDDVAHTPVFFSYCIVEMDRVQIFTYDKVLPEGFVLAEKKNYDEINQAVAEIPEGSTVWFNAEQANYGLLHSLKDGVTIKSAATPIELMKGIKNDTEISSTLHAHVKDGVAVTEFLHWIKTHADEPGLTEIDASNYLEECRYRQEGCFDLSFPTIAGYGPNGAIIHYEPTYETNAKLAPEGFLLVDSGAQYDDGTTDITRTIAMGPLTDKMKEYYTLVLKSHITLATQVFEPGTQGIELDRITRKPLNDAGLDYNHGTGHGVGHLLCVHEWPNNISPRRGEAPIRPGMITSNEPGVYIEGEFGIRLENETLCYARGDGKYAFRTITYAPFDRDAIVPEMLSVDELAWLNAYHKEVRETLTPHLPEETAKWLAEVTKEI